MKSKKRLSSFILAVIMLITALIPSTAFAYTYHDDEFFRHIGSDGYYYRLHNGVDIKYYVDFDEVAGLLRQALINHEAEVEFMFACPEDSQYYFDYVYTDDKADGEKKCSILMDDLYFAATKNSENFDGDYLASQISGRYYGYKDFFPNANDYITRKDGTKVRYANMGLKFVFNYYVPVATDSRVDDFIEKFNQIYISPDYTDYDKVKTIYDFVVRNSTYDYDVRAGRFPENSDRYNYAHSAYGAIYGNLSSPEEYNFETKTTITGQKVPLVADQGRAVCEGYSQLFYCLCKANGIPCITVNGDYTAASGHTPEAHQWNYVYIDDGVKSDGARWYQVDTTFASQTSMKNIDNQNYGFFLRGSSGERFLENVHQQPFKDKYAVTADGNKILQQSYDVYSDEYRVSVEDYAFPQPNFRLLEDDKTEVMICRRYIKNGEVNGSYILTNSKGAVKLEIEQNGDIFRISTDKNGNPIQGFPYNGQQCEYDIYIPYLIDSNIEIAQEQAKNMIRPDQYTITLIGTDDTKYDIIMRIQRMDLSDLNNYIYDLQTNADYTGEVINPRVTIKDGFDKLLVEGTDYTVSAYADKEQTIKVDAIRDIGTYYTRVDYCGNYIGSLSWVFTVGKMSFEHVDFSAFESTFANAPYYSESIRKSNNINTPTNYIKFLCKYNGGVITLNGGKDKLVYGVDFDITASGGLDRGDTGIITIVGLKSSNIIKEGAVKVVRYTIENGNSGACVEHNYDSGTIKKQATCTSTGIKVFTCVKCKATRTEEIPKAAHSYNVRNVAPTCTEKGCTMHTCSVCGYVFKDNYVDMIEHNIVVDNSVAPTCTKTGLSQGSHCSMCNKIIEPQEVLSATGHVKVNDRAVSPSCTEEGKSEGSHCSVCGEYIDVPDSIAPLGHKWNDGEIIKEPVECVSDGIAKYVCTSCGTTKEEVLPCHNYQSTTIAPTCTQEGEIIYICKCGDTYSQKVAPTGHTPQVIAGVAPTCTSTGLTEGSICSVCKTVLVAQTIIPKTEHIAVSGGYVAPTYSTPGKTTECHCAECNKVIVAQKPIAKLTAPVTSLSTVKSKKSKQLYVAWKKNTKATGYQIQIATNNKFTKNKKTVNVSKNKTTSTTIKKLKSKKKYYVRVRTYVTYKGKKYYSAWSGVKTAKIK